MDTMSKPQPAAPAEQELADFRKSCESRAEEARAAAIRHGREAEHFHMQANAAEAAVSSIASMTEGPQEVASPMGMGQTVSY